MGDLIRFLNTQGAVVFYNLVVNRTSRLLGVESQRLKLYKVGISVATRDLCDMLWRFKEVLGL